MQHATQGNETMTTFELTTANGTRCYFLLQVAQDAFRLASTATLVKWDAAGRATTLASK